MIDALPNRPVTPDELEAIRNAGDYELVRGGAWQFGPETERVTDEIVIVSSDWFAALRRDQDGWREEFRDDHDDEDPELLVMVALEELGLAGGGPV